MDVWRFKNLKGLVHGSESNIITAFTVTFIHTCSAPILALETGAGLPCVSNVFSCSFTLLNSDWSFCCQVTNLCSASCFWRSWSCFELKNNVTVTFNTVDCVTDLRPNRHAKQSEYWLRVTNRLKDSLTASDLFSIAHVRYIKILTWLRGFRVKIANLSRVHCLAIPRRDLSTKKTKPNIEKWPESLSHVRILICRSWSTIVSMFGRPNSRRKCHSLPQSCAPGI